MPHCEHLLTFGTGNTKKACEAYVIIKKNMWSLSNYKKKMWAYIILKKTCETYVIKQTYEDCHKKITCEAYVINS